MRILHCLRAPVGGLFRHVLDLASEQARRGHEVGILADSSVEDRLTASKFAAVEPMLKLGIHRTPIDRMPGVGDLAACRAVRSHAELLAVDVLHGHGAKGGAYARIAAYQMRRRGKSVKAFYTPHGGSLNYRPGTLQSQVFMAVERGLDPITTGLIFESSFAFNVYRDRIRAHRAAARVIPNGVQATDLSRAVTNPDATDLLFIGELRGVKGVDLLLQAIAEVRRSRTVTATIVGSGPDEAKLKALARDLEINDAVVFTGALPAREAFKRGRMMVVPSLAESFPYVVLEAAGAAIPLIATRVGGIPEIVEGTDTELIEAGSVPALVAALHATLADPQGAARRAERLRANVAHRFTVAGMTSAILDFYAAPDGKAAASGDASLEQEPLIAAE